MKQNIEQLDSIIEKANQSFEESIPSEEQYMTWNIGVEEEEFRSCTSRMGKRLLKTSYF